MDFGDVDFYSNGRGWQRQLHIYLYPFYYIDYCLAQTAALEFWSLSQKIIKTRGRDICVCILRREEELQGALRRRWHRRSVRRARIERRRTDGKRMARFKRLKEIAKCDKIYR